MDMYVLKPETTRDIAPLLLDADGLLKVVPAHVLAGTTAQERLLFGVRHGLYSFPTEELCNYLRERIAGRVAIEIGAGHGLLAKTLGIPATDNRQQEEPALKAHYASLQQPTVPYGHHVEKLDAHAAVRKYRPAVVIACWVTHRYDSQQPQAAGSPSGVDEAAIIDACEEYIFIGNASVHAHKPIWTLPHDKREPDWIYSRAVNGTPDFVATWRGNR